MRKVPLVIPLSCSQEISHIGRWRETHSLAACSWCHFPLQRCSAYPRLWLWAWFRRSTLRLCFKGENLWCVECGSLDIHVQDRMRVSDRWWIKCFLSRRTFRTSQDKVYAQLLTAEKGASFPEDAEKILMRERRTQFVGLLCDCWGVMTSAECRFKRLVTLSATPWPCFKSQRRNPCIMLHYCRPDLADCKGIINLFLTFTWCFLPLL